MPREHCKTRRNNRFTYIMLIIMCMYDPSSVLHAYLRVLIYYIHVYCSTIVTSLTHTEERTVSVRTHTTHSLRVSTLLLLLLVRVHAIAIGTKIKMQNIVVAMTQQPRRRRRLGNSRKKFTYRPLRSGNG